MIRNLTPDLAEACKTLRSHLPLSLIRQEMFSGSCQHVNSQASGKGVTNNSYSLSSPSKTESEGACFPRLALATQLLSLDCAGPEGEQQLDKPCSYLNQAP